MQLIFATQNKNKINELLKKMPATIQLQSLEDIGFTDDIEETGTTIEANALLKATFIFNKFKRPCIADDTGLEVDALNGEPGVYSARYAGKEKSDSANIEKLLLNLENSTNRVAKFKTVIAFCNQNQTLIFEGIVEGSITYEPIGTNGFGYDSIFIPKGYTTTFAQMTLNEKNQISHRAIAVSKLLRFITELQHKNNV